MRLIEEFLNQNYSRERALADGVLIDITDPVGLSLGFPCPVAVSVVLWNAPELGNDRRHLPFVIRASCDYWNWRHEVGRSGVHCYSVITDLGDDLAGILKVRMVLEAETTGAMTATYLTVREDYDLRTPRIGSFYTQ